MNYSLLITRDLRIHIEVCERALSLRVKCRGEEDGFGDLSLLLIFSLGKY